MDNDFSTEAAGGFQGQELVVKLDSVFYEIQEKENLISIAKEKGDQAKDKAQNVNTGFFKRKQAIEDLKDAGISNAEATVGALEAIEQVSENQKRLSELFQSFVRIGMVDIATNRAVVAYINKVMSGGTDHTISDETREQLIGVIKDLKAKEDLLIRQQRQGEKIKEHDRRITAVEGNTESLESELSRSQEHQKKQDEIINTQKRKDNEHDLRLDAEDKINKRQDDELENQRRKDSEHDLRLSKSEENDRRQDELLKQQREKDSEHDFKFEALDKCNTEQDQAIASLTSRIEALESAAFKNQADEICKLSMDIANLKKSNRVLKIIASSGVVIGVLGLIASIAILLL